MTEHYYLYGYRFKSSDLTPKYKELGTAVLYAMRPPLESFIPQVAGVKAESLALLELEGVMYAGIITGRISTGSKVNPLVNPCNVPANVDMALKKGWAKLACTNKTSTIEPDFYFI